MLGPPSRIAVIPRKASDEQAVRVRHLPQSMKGDCSLTSWTLVIHQDKYQKTRGEPERW